VAKDGYKLNYFSKSETFSSEKGFMVAVGLYDSRLQRSAIDPRYGTF